jgi:hypothetical protein
MTQRTCGCGAIVRDDALYCGACRSPVSPPTPFAPPWGPLLPALASAPTPAAAPQSTPTARPTPVLPRADARGGSWSAQDTGTPAPQARHRRRMRVVALVAIGGLVIVLLPSPLPLPGSPDGPLGDGTVAPGQAPTIEGGPALGAGWTEAPDTSLLIELPSGLHVVSEQILVSVAVGRTRRPSFLPSRPSWRPGSGRSRPGSRGDPALICRSTENRTTPGVGLRGSIRAQAHW